VRVEHKGHDAISREERAEKPQSKKNETCLLIGSSERC
jgi:hypothetical protein